ncbi:Utp18p [Ascoidea rubescens DSM 1968]|uniref:WD40 repeat-like protein n=1 Tax=Ascoidea rubescens DSM 1968 TaxID=1344418 RepID=A0A1D2VFA2_9ASCO|nr:WD40 repeat-like protein [Ascoidea rubescens DSM 1968]ODV60354.1 WD40 repeat-like protein [Ascoidea rubescens DSM 1968]
MGKKNNSSNKKSGTVSKVNKNNVNKQKKGGSKSKKKVKIEIPPKDEEELLLEKLVFGDEKGFDDNLKKLNDIDYNFLSDEDEEDEDDDNHGINDFRDIDYQSDEDIDQEMGVNTELLQDDELFFVDDGDNENTQDDKDKNLEIEVDKGSNSGNEDSDSDLESNLDLKNGELDSNSDAWEDSDDGKINIDILSMDRLKKLRKTENDSIISGKTYIKRLRAQYERIYPRPEWAINLSKNGFENEMNSDNEDGKRKNDNGNKEDDSDGEYETNEADTNNNSNSLIRLLSKINHDGYNISYDNNSKISKLLSSVAIDLTRLKDANYKHLSRAAIQTISFHINLPLLLTGGYDQTVRVYHIDGKNNNVVTTLYLKDSPIQTAYFSRTENSELNENSSYEIFSGGRRKYMYKWNIKTEEINKIQRLYGHESTQKSFERFKMSKDGRFIGLMGNNGYINLISSLNGIWIRNFKIEGVLADFDFYSNDGKIIVISTSGEIWEFEVESGNIIGKWKDNNGIGITKLSVGSKNDRFLAIGTNLGIVNIYDFQKRKLLNTMQQLTTSISSLTFNHDGQLLCMASRGKKDALRLVHLPSCQVFKNWPNSGTPLGKVTSVAFSPKSQMICVGNEAGKARLWKLNHYASQ